MKRKERNLPAVFDGEYGDEPKILDPIKLSTKDLNIVTVHGFKFVDTGYALACPTCGKISGISCREDLDLKIDFFLKFGCEHYKSHGRGSSESK